MTTHRSTLVLVLLSVAGCGGLRFVDAPSANYGSRVDYLVLHFTSENYAESMRLLTQPSANPVSVHYLVPENGDATYPRRRLAVHRLVPEHERAWHAGTSYWAGEEALNDRSIGIEIVNTSRCTDVVEGLEPNTPENQVCVFHDFDPEQIELVIALVTDILERYPGIDPVDVVGHADIAPDRKVDPGPKFPWRLLHEHGIGPWFDDETVALHRQRIDEQPPTMEQLQAALNAYGYAVEATGELDVQTRFALRAFQMHYRPSDWSGQPDAETAAILFALLDKYRTVEEDDEGENAAR